MIGKLLEMSRLFRSSNTPRAASLPSLIIPTHSLFFPPSYYSEQMCPLLARPTRHQGVWQGAGEERGRAAGAGLRPEEAGGDSSRQGERGGEKKKWCTQSEPTHWPRVRLSGSHAYAHTLMHNPAARTNKGIKSADLWDTRGREEKADCVRAQSLLRFSFFTKTWN